jgi:hypothetical protein
MYKKLEKSSCASRKGERRAAPVFLKDPGGEAQPILQTPVRATEPAEPPPASSAYLKFTSFCVRRQITRKSSSCQTLHGIRRLVVMIFLIAQVIHVSRYALNSSNRKFQEASSGRWSFRHGHGLLSLLMQSSPSNSAGIYVRIV